MVGEVVFPRCFAGVREVVLAVVGIRPVCVRVAGLLVAGIRRVSVRVAARAEAGTLRRCEMAAGLVVEHIRCCCCCAMVAVLGVARISLSHADLRSCCAEWRCLWTSRRCARGGRP